MQLLKDIKSISRCSIVWVFSTLSIFIAAVPALAQHPIDLQKLSASGEHLKAVTLYEVLPERSMTTDARIAAAKSAWALGLNQQASNGFDAVLRDAQITTDTRARLTLSRAIIEYQDEHYTNANLFAEKAISYLSESSPLRGRAYLLWGQSLSRMNAYSAAQEKLLAALNDSTTNDKAEIHFALGIVETKLGKYLQAEQHLKAIPTDHERASATVRMLASLALETHQNDRARFWIQKGRSDYPEAFIDSWGDYGLLEVALSKGEISAAREIFTEAKKQHPPSDPWLILMQAALEQFEWKKDINQTEAP